MRDLLPLLPNPHTPLPPPRCMQSRVEEGETKVEATLMPDLAPVQREMVRTMQPQVRQGGRGAVRDGLLCTM